MAALDPQGATTVAVAADVTDEASVSAAVSTVVQVLGATTILVNNAGFARDQPFGDDDRVNYAAAKPSLHGLTKACALELGPAGVTANVVAPGFIVSDMTRATARRLGRSFEEDQERVAATLPVRRVGQPDDVAHAVA